MTIEEAAAITVPMRVSPYWRQSLREVAASDAGLRWLRDLLASKRCKTFIFVDAMETVLRQPDVKARLEAL